MSFMQMRFAEIIRSLSATKARLHMDLRAGLVIIIVLKNGGWNLATQFVFSLTRDC